jgi:FkbM family methyltransferase
MDVGRESGTMEFDQGAENQTGWGGVVLAANSNSTVTVPVVRLDESLAAERFVDVLKIAIEGADSWALTGAGALLRKKTSTGFFTRKTGSAWKNWESGPVKPRRS